MAPATQIPVRLGQPRRDASNGFVQRPPLISVHVASDDVWNATAQRWPIHNGVVYTALLDTGSDHCALDQGAASEVGAVPFGNGYAHGIGSRLNKVEMAAVQILIPTANVIFLAQVAVVDFRGVGQQWDLLLGRDFLRNCRLVVDGPTSRYELEWVGSAPASN